MVRRHPQRCCGHQSPGRVGQNYCMDTGLSIVRSSFLLAAMRWSARSAQERWLRNGSLWTLERDAKKAQICNEEKLMDWLGIKSKQSKCSVVRFGTGRFAQWQLNHTEMQDMPLSEHAR